MPVPVFYHLLINLKFFLFYCWKIKPPKKSVINCRRTLISLLKYFTFQKIKRFVSRQNLLFKNILSYCLFVCLKTFNKKNMSSLKLLRLFNKNKMAAAFLMVKVKSYVNSPIICMYLMIKLSLYFK